MAAAPDAIVDALTRACRRDAEERAPQALSIAALRITSSDELLALLEALETFSEHFPRPAVAEAGDAALAEVCARLWQYLQTVRYGRGLEPETVARIQRLYGRLEPLSRARPHLLRALAAAGDGDSLAAFVELLSVDPPRASGADAALPFVPLFQRSDYAVEALFPRLLDILDQPAYAAVVLDLANHVTRRGRVDEHPAAGRVQQLAALLGGLVQQLECLAERPQEFSASPQELTRLVGEGVALIVPLCDALALVGDDRVAGKLHQAMGLAHRRIRTEAAAALARLGDAAGLETLVQMAAHPTVRTRALAYLEELGQLQRAPEELRSLAARAEGDVAAWLAEPAHFGAPPAQLEMVDACRLYWPGYGEPVACFLFRFEYALGGRRHSGIALAGPLTHVLDVDLQDLPPADIYAVYAGWCAEHAEIRETRVEALTPPERAAWSVVGQRLEALGYTGATLEKLAHFFDQTHWVATARHEGREGVAIVAGEEIHWRPASASRRGLGPTEVYYLYKGREILRTFNPAGTDGGAEEGQKP